MAKNQSDLLLMKKQKYEEPSVQLYRLEPDDVITSSGMGWYWDDDWTPDRDDTVIG